MMEPHLLSFVPKPVLIVGVSDGNVLQTYEGTISVRPVALQDSSNGFSLRGPLVIKTLEEDVPGGPIPQGLKALEGASLCFSKQPSVQGHLRSPHSLNQNHSGH